MLKHKLGLALVLVLASVNAYSSDRKSSPACAGSTQDNNVLAAGLAHNSFDTFYRNPFGAVKTDQNTVRLRFRSCHYDIDKVRIRLWNSREKKESWVEMAWDSTENDPSLGPVDYWKAEINIPATPTLLYYFFEITDGWDINYYVDDNAHFYGGGWGRFSEHWDDLNTYQITVYEKDFQVPSWLKGSIIYQILPDRFRNGNKSNDPVNGNGFIFNKRIRKLEWREPLCDPRGEQCRFESDNQFYGGDLAGVLEKLDYLKNLGVEAIYFNPIFESATNHKYDTQDYLSIDKELGDLAVFQQLAQEAEKRDIRIILDGVFNHGSSDSPYFDLYYRWSPTAACRSTASPFRDWFYFPHRHNKPEDHNRPGTYYYCAGENNSRITYESWYGYFEHPVFNKENREVRKFFFSGGSDSIARYWLRNGASSWRLDVASDVSKGEGLEPNNDYWMEFRKAVKTENQSAAIIAEEWSDASSLLLGREMDTVMNYRFRSALMNWLSDGCIGNGCYNGVYEDEDSNSFSTSGPIFPILETELEQRLKSIEEDYPKESWLSAMNLIGSHDTQRILFILKKISKDNASLAIEKLKFLTLFQFTYPGSPTVYYGDEAGLATDGVWFDSRWRDDPYSRGTYPWADEGLSPNADLIKHYEKLGQIRHENSVFKHGEYQTILADNVRRVFAFKRFHLIDGTPTDEAYVVLNRSMETSHNISLESMNPKNGTFVDILNGGTYRVNEGQLNCGAIRALWGKILVRLK